MIDDGPVFKLGIHRAVKRFERDLQAWPRPPERGGEGWDSYWRWRFEDVLITVGLGVRKLVEAGKLSVEVQARPIHVLRMPLRSARVPDTLNVHRADEFYDIEAGQDAPISLVKLCHAIVHSYVLLPRFTYSGPSGLQLQGFLLASDRDRRNGAYLINWPEFIRSVVEPVVSDDVTTMYCLRTGQGDELRIPMASGELLAGGATAAIEFFMGLSKENRKAVTEFSKRFAETWGHPPPDIPSDIP